MCRSLRDWGDDATYCAAPDGNVLVIAKRCVRWRREGIQGSAFGLERPFCPPPGLVDAALAL
jgi:hypothetical protein